MKRVCAWCGKDLGEIESSSDETHAVTHGMCLDCAANFMREELGQSFRDFLDGLGVPVLAIHSDSHVITANRQACDLLGKDPSVIDGRMGGEVMECVHASKPGGCGNQVHCKSCTIRNAVMATFETGQSRKRVPAYLDVNMFAETRRVELAITTEKVGGVVLVRVDSFAGKDLDSPSAE